MRTGCFPRAALTHRAKGGRSARASFPSIGSDREHSRSSDRPERDTDTAGSRRTIRHREAVRDGTGESGCRQVRRERSARNYLLQRLSHMRADEPDRDCPGRGYDARHSRAATPCHERLSSDRQAARRTRVRPPASQPFGLSLRCVTVPRISLAGRTRSQVAGADRPASTLPSQGCQATPQPAESRSRRLVRPLLVEEQAEPVREHHEQDDRLLGCHRHPGELLVGERAQPEHSWPCRHVERVHGFR